MTIWETAKIEQNWLVYRLKQREGKKPLKIPQSHSGNNIGPKAAATLNFDQASALANSLGDDCGIGYLPREGSAIVCVDFDDVLKDGEVTQCGLPEFGSYTEISPSKTGLHSLVARPGDREPQSFDDGNDWVGYIGSDNKFFTVSLDQWGENTEIEEDVKLVSWVFKRHSKTIDDQREKKEVMDAQWANLRRSQLKNQRHHWFYQLPVDLRAECATEMLSVLPPHYASGYDTWLHVGMAFKLADEEFELFDAWDKWSQTSSNYDGRTSEKWDSLASKLRADKKMLTMASVIHWARKYGWDSEPWKRTAREITLKGLPEKLGTRDSTLPHHRVVTDTNANSIEDRKNLATVKKDLTRPGGLVEALTDYGAQRSSRLTRSPAIGGALAAVSALTQRNYMVVTPGFQTSPGLQVVVVGDTGTGKEVTRDIVSDVCRLCDGIGMVEAYASAPAMHRALNDRPTQLWANDEFGRFLKAASKDTNGGHDFGIVTMSMKLHTMFTKYLPRRIYSSETAKPAVNHPLMVTAHTTTPKALYDAMTKDTVVDGMLGRMLVIQIDGTPALKPLDEVRAVNLPVQLVAKIESIKSKLASHALGGFVGAEMVDGMDDHKFIAITAAPAAKAYLEVIRQDCEVRATADVARALWSRAYEQILRVAGVVAFGHAVTNDCLLAPKITEDILFWARDFVYQSLGELVPEAEEHASDGDRDKLQKGILRSLKNLETKAGPDRWVKKQDLLQVIKGRGRNYQDLRNEIIALSECGDIEHEKGENGSPTRPERIRTRV